MTALTLSAIPAGAVVAGGQSIEVFTGSNLLSLTGYPAGEAVRVEVLRQNVVIGSAEKTADPDGAIEMNHVGGTDCFDGPTSPDIKPGDRIRTTVVSDPANRDTSVVRGVFIDDLAINDAANTITVSGHVTRSGPAGVTPITDVLELRINKDSPWDENDRVGRRDRRVDIGDSVQPNGSWSITLNASNNDVNDLQTNGFEHFLEWSAGAAAGEEEEAFPSELTVWDEAGGEALDCPPLQQGPTAPALLASMDSGKRGDHITNVAANLTFRGLAGPDSEGTTVEPGPNAVVELWVNGTRSTEGTARANGVYEFTGVTLPARARPHSVMVKAKDAADGAFFDSPVRLVTVDTSTPSVALRRLAPKPLHLAGPERLRAVYRVSEAAQLRAVVQKMPSKRTVKRFAVRNVRRAGPVQYFWNGKTATRRDVRPGRYRMVLTATDAAGNRSSKQVRFRVVR